MSPNVEAGDRVVRLLRRIGVEATHASATYHEARSSTWLGQVKQHPPTLELQGVGAFGRCRASCDLPEATMDVDAALRLVENGQVGVDLWVQGVGRLGTWRAT